DSTEGSQRARSRRHQRRPAHDRDRRGHSQLGPRPALRRGRGRLHLGAGAPMNPVTATRALARRNSNGLLVLVCLAQYMVILDVSIVNVALPAIHDDLNFSTTGLQWVVNAYTLTFAGFLMLGGRAADLLGRRRVLLFGTGAFAASSALCAVVSSPGLLIAARAVQGLAGAVVSPA